MSGREWESGLSRRLIVGLCLLPLLILGVRGLGWYFIPSPPPAVGMTSEEFEAAIQATGVFYGSTSHMTSLVTYQTRGNGGKVFRVVYKLHSNDEAEVIEWSVVPDRGGLYIPLRTWLWF